MAGSKSQTDNLEKALLERATKLADEYIQRDEEQRNDIHRELREKLHLSEEREILSARAKAERVYQQRVQASELQLQAKLDHLRWQLVQQILDEAMQSLRKLAEDEKKYLPVLKEFLQDAANAIPCNSLVLEVNQRDYRLLQENDARRIKEWLPGKNITFTQQYSKCVGGVRVHDYDNRIRVDNTFEGRIAKLREQLEQSIMEHLFHKTMTTGEMIHG